jgi:hypothetical protein
MDYQEAYFTAQTMLETTYKCCYYQEELQNSKCKINPWKNWIMITLVGVVVLSVLLVFVVARCSKYCEKRRYLTPKTPKCYMPL